MADLALDRMWLLPIPGEAVISCLNCGGGWPECGCDSYGVYEGKPIIMERTMTKLTEREAMILAYLSTIAEPPGKSVQNHESVARYYLKEKLEWIESNLKSERQHPGDGDMFRNLDPNRSEAARRKFKELMG